MPKIGFAQTADHLVISEIQITGGTGQTTNDFIEIYNPTNSIIDLSDWQLKRRTTSGTESSMKVFSKGKNIPAHGYFLWANSKDNYHLSINADESSVAILTDDNSIALFDSANNLIDALAWGSDHTNPFIDSEHSIPCSGNPEANQSIERRPGGTQGNSQDTNNNSVDFLPPAIPNPQNSQSPPQPPIQPTSPVCGNGACESGEDTASCSADCPALPPETPPTQNIASPGDMVINELLPWTAEGDEWIELYLNKTDIFDLTNYKIYDNTSKAIITLAGSLNPENRFAIFETHNKLNNDGDSVTLMAPDGTTVIDKVIYGKATENAPLPKKAGQAVARKSNGLDTNNDAQDFALTDQPTKNSSNIILQTQTEIVGGGTNVSNIYTVPKALIYINELVSDPTDGENEWMELYNAGSTSVELEGWFVEDGSGAKTTLSGTLIPGQFQMISPINGSLNNSGDLLYLKDNKENIFDRLAYGVWDDGNIFDNAPAAADPASIARACDGCSTNNPSKDFFIAQLPTKGKSNQGQAAESAQNYQAKIILNELLPDPRGDDSQDEFIELKNLENRLIPLNGWYLKDAAGKKYVLSGNISSGGFLLIKRSQSGLALNNNVDTVSLFNPDDQQKDKIAYNGAKEGFSFAQENNQWQWTSRATPGLENIFASENHPPQLVISFPPAVIINQPIEMDAGDSFDEDDDEIVFNWLVEEKKFSGPFLRYSFSELGEKIILLEASDGQEKISQEIKIKTVEKLAEAIENNLYLSELMPNPEGSDAAEWLEFFNAGQTALGIAGFKIIDESGQSHRLPEGTQIQPNAYSVLERAATKIALNNSSERVKFFDQSGRLIQEISYQNAPEGLTWSRQSDNSFAWSQPSKGLPNNAPAAGNNKETAKSKNILEIPLKEIRQEDLGEKIKTRGVVSVPPGILGSQIFYLAGSGMQVYLYKKDFPELKIGDLVEVIGEISETQGERRIKVASGQEIKVLAKSEPPTPQEISALEIGEDTEGNLVSIAGTIIENRGQKLILDDGNEEVVVYLKKTTGINPQNFSDGNKIKVTGIVSQRNGVYEILPRFLEDIEILSDAPAAVAGEKIKNQNDEKIAKKYLLITLVGFSIISLVLILRRWMKKSSP